MQCGIITHYDVHNHGAILQLLALKNVLKKRFNIEAKALQFEKNYDFLGSDLKNKYNISIRSFGYYWDYFKERGISAFYYNFQKRKTLEKFKMTHSLVGKYYTDYANLDYIIIGSDEVFALHTGPTPVFWGHGLPSDRVFSYAGSFGPTTLEDIYRLHCAALASSGLSNMNGVSVRDQNSKEIIYSLTGIDTPVVVDPVLLYGYPDEIAQQKKQLRDKYMIVYAYDKRMNSADEVDNIVSFARRNKLKIVSPGFYHKWADLNVNTDPIELLGWFKYADYVITDTFHGTVMSLITNRPVSTIVRDNSNKLLNLLKEYHLEDRLMKNIATDLPQQFPRPINYIKVNGYVEQRRLDSLKYLQKQINEE
ncbi:MAG: polysaccharide pyruvyl transferase family protein [Bacteroidales bacterium]|uniref:polysaccharide pyruvyl transferase family protein n=1 Tax=Porphyromonas sp. TaxID=1924944 RepID=UPI0029720EDF|nr:polysaccharide pyruvyl transferase family protein [Porphyromonas sp.]MDD7438334.1 polysaccharide pyruvyl transferase family protein [Bacteroidales bacterium]MDY3066759.1 polysaccharide pyruvyl transferase family protein [Porphyromonas sp.]